MTGAKINGAFGNGGLIRVLAVVIPLLVGMFTSTVYVTHYLGKVENKGQINAENIGDIEEWIERSPRPLLRSIGSRVTTLENNQTHFSRTLEKIDRTLERLTDRLSEQERQRN